MTDELVCKGVPIQGTARLDDQPEPDTLIVPWLLALLPEIVADEARDDWLHGRCGLRADELSSDDT